jgi:hypothetical protein
MLQTLGQGSGSTDPVRRRVRTATLISILGALGILLAACSSASANASTSKTTAASGAASLTAYTNCLKSHGVTLPAGGFGRGGGGGGFGGPPPSGATGTGGTRPTIPASERTALTKAEAACASLRPKFNGTGGGNSTAFAAYRNCLKLHGVTLPAGRGGFGGSPGTSGSTTTPTTEDAKTKAALAACKSLLPKGGFGGRPGASTTTTS